MTCSEIKLEVSSEDEVVVEGIEDDVCGLCGRHFAFLDQLNDRFNKHTDEVCCHLCPTKFSHINSLAMHIKSVHPSLCKSCILGQHLSVQWPVKTEETLEEKPILVKVEEVITETEEVEIKYVKEEKGEELVERFVTNKENILKEPPEGDKMVKKNWQDHNYFSTQACSSLRNTANDVMYTSNDNVTVVINKSDTSTSTKDAYTEIDQQRTPLGDQTGICDDDVYIHSQSHANHVIPVEQKPAHNICSNFSRTTDNVMDPSTENQHVINDKFRVSPKDPESSASHQDLTEKHELVHLLDHDYVSTQSLENHPFLSKQKVQSKENTQKNHSNDVPLAEESTRHSSTATVQSSGCNIKEDLQPIPEFAVIEEHVEIFQQIDHKDSHTLSIDDLVYTFQDGLCSNTISTGTNRYMLHEEKSWSAGQNAEQEPHGPAGSVNSNPAATLYKVPEICTLCGRSKVFNGKDSMERCTCKELSTCCLCGMVFDDEKMLLSHQANKHPSAKYICARCKRLFSNQSLFLKHVCSKSTRFSRESFKDPDSFESHQVQTRWHELVQSNFLDHNYVSTESLQNHPVLLKQVPIKENTWKNHSSVSLIKENTWHSSTALLQPLQGGNFLFKDNFKLIPEKAVIEKHVEIIQRSDHKGSHILSLDDLVYTFQDGLCSNTISTGTNRYMLNEEKSWSAGQKQTCGNAEQEPHGPAGSVNSNPAATLYKVPQICTLCGRSKVFNGKDSMERCTCKELSTCCLCGMVFDDEKMLLSHQANKHPSAKYICARCKRLFSNQSLFLKHVCSKSTRFSRESFAPSNGSNFSKEPPAPILKLVPLPAAEYFKQPISCQSVGVNIAQKLGTVLNSTLHSLPNSLSTSASQKAPVHAMTTRSSSCAQKKVTCCTSNGDQKDKVTDSLSTVTENPKRLFQVVSTLQAVPQTTSSFLSPSSFSFSSSPSQSLGELTPIPTVSMSNQATIAKIQEFSQLSQPQQQPESEVHLLQVSSSVSVPSQTDQQPERGGPIVDICSFSSPAQILPVSQEPLKIVAMFVNQSRELALQKRMRQSWRSKAVFPCRRCGAVSRQFSLGVRHRYQHRGPRLYRCQCGRTFHQRMHLLRHQVQHAEATRYVCAACGQMFCGTRLLACHRIFFGVTHSNRKKQVTKECRNVFQCYCGHSFTRPAALLWHMLKNSSAH